MGKEITMLGNIEIKKYKYYNYQRSTFLEDVDIKNASVSNMISSGEKNYKLLVTCMITKLSH